jgi:hypothetical protein
MPFTPMPQAVLAQEFAAAPTTITDHLRPMIVGPQALLTRFAQAAEQALALIGSYDPSSPHTYAYPNQQDGAIQNESFVAVWIQNALLNYYDKEAGVGGYTIQVPNSNLNEVRASNFVYKTGNGFNRDGSLLRDVVVGDVIDISATVSAVLYTLRTTVSGFVAEVVAASTASAVANGGNHTTQGASTSQSQTSGTSNHVEIASVAGGSYNGLLQGDINETYTVVVTTGSTGGNATIARLSVTSASGHDNLTNVTPAAFSSPTAIGTRGLTATWDTGGSGGGSPAGDFIIGQTWQILVHQAFTAPTATSAGVYTGTINNTYIVTVSQGGTYGSGNATITVTSTAGVDASGPTVVNAAATPFPVGTLGATISFNQTALCKGDIYTIAVTAAGQGKIQTLQLTTSLPSGIEPATDITVKLSIKQTPATIPAIRASSPGVFNWTAGASTILINSGILAYDPSWANGGVPQPLAVTEGTVYVDTQQWLQDWVGKVGTFTPATDADIAAELGLIDPDNPLCFATDCAFQNASGSLIGFTAVSDPTSSQAWQDALNTIAFYDDVYNIVPLTQDETILPLFKTQVDFMAGQGVRCGYWQSLVTRTTIPIVTAANTTDLAIAQGTVAISGGNYVLVTNSTNNALFITNGVAAGDLYRTSFATDSWGNVTYTNYAIASVISENQLLLVVPGTGGAISPAIKFEIWRNLSQHQKETDLKTRLAPFQDRLIKNVWPDVVGGLPGYYLAAALGGEASGAPSQQSLRTVQVVMPAGFSDLSQYSVLMAADIVDLQNNGVWVVGKATNGQLYTKSAVTLAGLGGTGALQDVNEMLVRNADGIIGAVLDRLSQYIGRTNITPDALTTIQNIVNEVLLSLLVTGAGAAPGPVILDIITPPTVTQSSITRDDILVVYTIQLAAPLDEVSIQQTIVI